MDSYPFPVLRHLPLRQFDAGFFTIATKKDTLFAALVMRGSDQTPAVARSVCRWQWLAPRRVSLFAGAPATGTNLFINSGAGRWSSGWDRGAFHSLISKIDTVAENIAYPRGASTYWVSVSAKHHILPQAGTPGTNATVIRLHE